jgi:hypothetical protein
LLTGVGLQSIFDGQNDVFDYKKTAPNGISFLLMYWGIIGMAFYLAILYKGLKYWVANLPVANSYDHAFIFFILLFLSFSQGLTAKLFFFFLLTLFVVFKPKPSVVVTELAAGPI